MSERSCCDGRCPPCVNRERNRLLRAHKDAPMEPHTPAALGDETGGADGAGGLSPSPPVTNASIHSKNRGGRP